MQLGGFRLFSDVIDKSEAMFKCNGEVQGHFQVQLCGLRPFRMQFRGLWPFSSATGSFEAVANAFERPEPNCSDAMKYSEAIFECNWEV